MSNTTIQIKRSGSPGNTPSSGELSYGELGLNYNDGFLFYKDHLGQIQKIFASDSFSTVQANSELLLASSPYSVLTFTSSEPIIIEADPLTDTINLDVRYATTTTSGVVKIYDGVDSSNSDLVASANSVSIAYNYADDAYGLANTANTGVTDLYNLVDALTISAHTKETTGIVSRDESTISFNNSNRTFTISAVSNTFTLYCQGTRYHKTSDSVQIPNTTGLYYIYYNSIGVLSYKTSFFTLSVDAPVSYVYWNATLGAQQFFADERHGVTMDWATHEYLHRTRGAALASGFGIGNYTTSGNGTSNTHIQVNLGGGTFYDEDIPIVIVDDPNPTPNTFEQILSTPAKIPMFYLQNSGEWKLDTATDFPMTIISQTPQFNLLANSTWSLSNVLNNTFFVTYVIASNNLGNPVFGIIGQAEKTTIDEARSESFSDLYLPGFPVVEFRPLYKLIFQHKSIYTNAAKSVLVEVQDLRVVSAILPSAASAVSAHNQLTGLSSDDHLQYVHNDIPRTITAVHTFNPSSNSAPFELSGAAVGHLVTGLNADYIDGMHFSDLESRYISSNSSINISWSNISANTTAVNGSKFIANTSSNSFTVLLPASPSLGDLISIADGYDWSINPLTVDANGETIRNSSSTITLNYDVPSKVDFIYNGSTWKYYTSSAAQGGGGGGSGTSGIVRGWTEVIADTQTYSGDQLIVNTQFGLINITLPETPSTGSYVSLMDKDNFWSTHSITILRNGSTIDGLSENLVVNVGSMRIDLVYNGNTWEVSWMSNASAPGVAVILEDDLTLNDIQYLTMARSNTGIMQNSYVCTSKLYFNANTGTLTSTNQNLLSDQTLKTNIKPISNALDILQQINAVSFNWIDNNKQSYGVIAQELEKILPEMVESGDDNIKSVSYTQLIPFLISAVTEQQKQIEQLNKKNKKVK